MKAKKLKEILNTNYTIQETENKICVSSYYVTDLIAIDKKSLKLTYALDTFHEGRDALKTEELERIWDKLSEMIKDDSIKDIINGNDSIEGMKEFWYYDNESKTIIKSYSDVLEYPIIDYTGKFIYEENCFNSEDEAKQYGIKTLLKNLKLIQEFIISESERYNDRMNDLYNRIMQIQNGLEKLILEKGVK